MRLVQRPEHTKILSYPACLARASARMCHLDVPVPKVWHLHRGILRAKESSVQNEQLLALQVTLNPIHQQVTQVFCLYRVHFEL